MKSIYSANSASKKAIEWRSNEPSRLETFSDAVFAFAVTLVIVSLEVPKSFNDLLESMKGFVSFAACFIILFQIWNTQNIFFRRFGLTDGVTITLNGMFLFVILIYTYPLKFLFTLVFSNGSYLEYGISREIIQPGNICINTGIGLLAVLLTTFLPLHLIGASGFVYFLIPFVYTGWFSLRSMYKPIIPLNSTLDTRI